MELSNVKLKFTLDRKAASLDEALAGTVRFEDFKARGLVGKKINKLLGTYSFINESEGYHAQHVAGDRYRITGHWIYGDEIVREEIWALGHKVSNVRAIRESMVTTRPDLRVVSAEDEYAAA